MNPVSPLMLRGMAHVGLDWIILWINVDPLEMTRLEYITLFWPKAFLLSILGFGELCLNVKCYPSKAKWSHTDITKTQEHSIASKAWNFDSLGLGK